MTRRILITGASIAGNAAAFWLGKAGFDVTVVDKWPSFREGGQNIDVRGAGREVLRRMGLEQEALARGTKEKGTAWIGSDGKVVAQFITDDLGEDGPTAELEILRGDLSSLLYEPAKQHARYRFGDSIAQIEDQADAVNVTFTGGTTERYDIVIVAEGVGSTTRELLFPNGNRERWMNLTTAYFTIPRIPSDDRMWRWFNSTRGRSVSLRPDPYGTTRAVLSVQKRPEGEQHWDADKQKTYLKKEFADAGWQAPRVLEGLEKTNDFYFDVLRQVRLERWSKGRIVLTGDAAWCATPMAGIGTTLALTGAYVLAQELSGQSETATAFRAYEAGMRPMVEQGQDVPKIGPRLMNPQSRAGITLLHAALRLASSPLVRKIAGPAFSRKPKEPDLNRSRQKHDELLRSGR